MDYAGLRAEARKRLAGKWGKVILVLIVTGLIVGLVAIIPSFTQTRNKITFYGITVGETREDNFVSVTLTLVATVVSVVFSYGLLGAFWKIYHGEDVGAADGLKIAVANWKRALMVFINVVKKILIPVIMIVAAMYLGVIIPNVVVKVICSLVTLGGYIWGFIVGLHYVLALTIAFDEPNLSEEEAVNKSKVLMENKRGKYVVLYLTFFGWIVLGVISLGIGMLWVTPYMQFAAFAFYENCKGLGTTTPETKAE